jgi:drug/metabolite transporter (DMT)-like permease
MVAGTAAAPRGVTRRFAITMLVVVVLAWGFAWPVNKLILLELSPIWAVALRVSAGCAAMFAITAAMGRLRLPQRADLPVVVSIALLHMVGFSVLSSIGLQLVSTGRSVVLAYTVSLWVVPGARLFLGERITLRRALGATMGLSGLVLLFNPAAFDWRDGAALLGNLALLASALCWVASILHIRGHRWRGDTFELLPWELLVATVILLAIAGATPWPTVTWSGHLSLLVLYAALPGTAIAYWATAVASRGLPSITMSIGLLGAPLISISTAVLAMGEPLSPALIAAQALIIGGIAVGATDTPGARPAASQR